MYLGLGLRLTGRLGSGGRANSGVTLAASAVSRGATLAAQPVANRLRMWSNDPASADRVGRYRAGGPAAPLSDAAFASIFSFFRSSKAWDVDANGALTELAANAIRQGYNPATLLPAGWLLEGAATNLIRNSRAEGSTSGLVGSGGVLPTNWTLPGQTANTVTVVGTGAESGIPYIDIQFDASGAGAGGLYFEASSGAPFVGGATYAGSVYARLLSGSLSAFSSFGLRVRTDLGTAANGTFVSMLALSGAALATQRFAVPQVVAADATGGRLNIVVASTGAGTAVVRFGGPQLEQNYYASSLILPPVGAPAAASRTVEAMSIAGNAFAAIFGAGAPSGFVICDMVLPQVAGAVQQTLLSVQLDTNNRMVVVNGAGVVSVSCINILGGNQTSSPATGAITAGTPFRVGLKWAAGSPAALCFGGGASVSASGATPAGLTDLWVGRSLTSYLNGRVLNLWLGANGAISDAAFRSACTPGNDPVAVLA